jgi:hypothetical protein
VDLANTVKEGIGGIGKTVAEVGGEVPGTLAKGFGGVMGPLGMFFGGMDIGKGINELRDPKGDGGTGVIDILKGTLGAGSGFATTATAAGLGGIGGGAMAAAGPVLGAGAAGLGVGKLWGDWIEGASKGRWGKDEGGKDQSVFDIAGDMGVSADQWVNKKVGGGTLGNILGTTAGVGTSAAMGIGGAVAGSVDWLGSKVGLW